MTWKRGLGFIECCLDKIVRPWLIEYFKSLFCSAVIYLTNATNLKRGTASLRCLLCYIACFATNILKDRVESFPLCI